MRFVSPQLLNQLRSSPPYEAWRLLRERQQLSRIADFVGAGRLGAAGAARSACDALESRRTQRRQIGASPHTVGFGTNDWEQFGLWPAFGKLGRFSLFDYRAAAQHAPAPTADIRRDLGAKFLTFLEETQRTSGPVDVVFFYAAGAWIDLAMIRALAARGIWTVLMGLDDKQLLPGATPRENETRHLEAAAEVDLYWTTWRSGADWLASRGVRVWYAAEAADPDQFAPRPVPRDIDVLWLGRAYGPRLGLVRWLRARGFDVRTYGPGWPGGPVPFDEMIELISRAHVVLGMGGVGQTDRIKHLKGRDFEVPMCGAAYLTSFNPELTDHFVIGREILCYASEVECAEMLGYLLRRPDFADTVRAAARARSLADHTWKNRMQQMYSILTGDPA